MLASYKKASLSVAKTWVALIITSFLLPACSDSDMEFDPAKIGRQQQPFGMEPVDVKLAEVRSDGQVITRFEYAGGLFVACRKYLKFYGYPAEYGIYTLFREKGLPVRYEKKTADFDPDIRWVSDDLKTRVLTTYGPASDSTWKVFDKHYVDNQEVDRVVAFSPNGLMNSESVTVKYPEKTHYTLRYQRDQGGNVRSVWKESQANLKEDQTDYEYDNHPNPFFKVGVDLAGDESINAKSPNNVTREVTYGTGGENKVVTYSYQYNEHGYPVQVTRKSKEPASEEQVETYEFIYE
jgi:hypothetical protein